MDEASPAVGPTRLAAVQRGAHATGWYRGQHNYHPSLPPRRLRMVEELAELGTTVLAWPALGGGAISLPWLQDEAFGEVPARMRLHGYVNDAEFVGACRARGMVVFGVVFSVQGWEFGVELDENEGTVLAINELRGVGVAGELGLREFSSDRYPRLWPPFEHYFPDGLHNSRGERVTDLLAECCTRNARGEPCHAGWLEVPDRAQTCLYMDRNNPVWMEYLKAQVRIQIDAGVDGIQFDEPDTPLASIAWGGCFCHDCTVGFAGYLSDLAPSERPAALVGTDLRTFSYRDWLLEQGCEPWSEGPGTPLFSSYVRYQRQAGARTFRELARYVREYGRERGRDVLVAANFYSFFDRFHGMQDSVDLALTEQQGTRYRQPAWYTYAAGFSPDRPVVCVMQPYGRHSRVHELSADLQRGRSYDRYRSLLYEAATFGLSMSVPYGAWMGTRVADAFYAPTQLSAEVQRFLAGHEELITRETWHDTAVVYSVRSALSAGERDRPSGELFGRADGQDSPFWRLTQALSDRVQPYDVVVLPEPDEHAEERAPDLERWSTLVMPDCRSLSDRQVEALQARVDAGAQVLAVGELDARLRGVRELPDEAAVLAHLAPSTQVVLDPPLDAAVTLRRTADGGAAVHLLRYDHDDERDGVVRLDGVQMRLRLPFSPSSVTAHSPDGLTGAQLISSDSGQYTLRLSAVGLYAIVEVRA